MKLLLLPLLFSLFTPQAFAADNESYEEILAYAFKRTASEIPKEKVIFCLGPQQLDEFYFEEGKEKKRVARYAVAFSTDKFKTVNDIFKKYSPMQPNRRYELNLYRQTTKQALVRIVATEFELFSCQFHLNGGDIIIIRPVKTDAK